MTGPWELYGTLRLVHVTNDPVEFRNQDTGKVDFTVASSQYNYAQAILGTRYWLSPHWLLSLEAGSLFGISSGISFDSNVLAGASFGYRF